MAICEVAGLDPDAYTTEQDMENLFIDLASYTITLPLVMGPDRNPQYLKAYVADKSTNAVPVRPDAAPAPAPRPLPQDRPVAPRQAPAAAVATPSPVPPHPAARPATPAPVA
ncbi:MAG TPA: hypothetical protein PKL26_07400, partial [Methanolinea sp.]|nr:hypothetical protein [Methanolinea sp.]